jgi:hypothetical protein
MSTQTKRPPRRDATAIEGPAVPACAQQTVVIGAAADAGIAATFIPRPRRAGSRRSAARAHRRRDSRTGSAPRPMT